MPTFNQPPLAGNTNEVQRAEPAVSDKPKRRWFQFSLGALLTLMTLFCLGMAAWLNHRAFCLSQSERFRPRSDGILIGGYMVPGGTKADHDAWKRRMDERSKLKERQRQTAAAYRHAIWYPWERLWIDNPPPPDKADEDMP
jgi:hypothetical protein